MELMKIMQKAQETANKRYYRTNVLNQHKGLTDFVKLLEEKAKNENINFEIMSCSVHEVIPYEVDNWGENRIFHEDEKEILLGSYVGFMWGDDYYYFQIEDNPFFRQCYYKVKPEKDSKGLFYYGYCYMLEYDPFGDLDTKELYGYNNTARKKIAENLLKSFENAKYSRSYRGRGKANAQNHKTRIEENIYFTI